MADENEAAANPPKLRVLGQYIRDMSFENAAMQNGTTGQVPSDIQVQVGLDARKRDTEGQFEVIMKFKIESKTKEEEPKPVFLIELDYAGVVLLENVPEQQLHPFLLIEGPRMMFPFVRRIVSDVTRDGGFPPLNLEQVDFVSLYRQQLQAQVAMQQAQKEPS